MYTLRGETKVWSREEPFPCSVWCGQSGELFRELQDRRHCTLMGYSGNWTDPANEDRARLGVWMGANPTDVNGVYDRRPSEPLCEGCPGGWARCGFAASMHPYRRAILSNGGHDNNPLVHAGTPPHILEALRYFESQESAAQAEFDRVRYQYA